MLAGRERPERRSITGGQRRAPRAPAGTVAVEMEGNDHGWRDLWMVNFRVPGCLKQEQLPG